MALQVISFLFSISRKPLPNKRPPQASASGNVIICIGDSFTFGLGATKHSYPSQLEEMLCKNKGKEIKVLNLGIPGYNSYQAFMSFKENCKQYNPLAVIILVGLNNEWSIVGMPIYTLQEKADRFLLNFRTYKLVKLLMAYFRNKINNRPITVIRDQHFFTSQYKVNSQDQDIAKLEEQVVKYYNEADYVNAKKYCQMLLQLEPNSFYAHLHLGRIYSLEGDKQMAIKSWVSAARSSDNITASLIPLNEIRGSVKNRNEFNKIITPYLKEIALKCDDAKKGEKYLKEILYNTSFHRIIMLKMDIESMVRYARERNAVPLLVTYPHFYSGFIDAVNDAIKIVAKQNNVILVDSERIFFQIQKTNPDEFNKLFVPDGHCSGQGYKIIAEEVYRVISDKVQ